MENGIGIREFCPGIEIPISCWAGQNPSLRRGKIQIPDFK